MHTRAKGYAYLVHVKGHGRRLRVGERRRRCKFSCGCRLGIGLTTWPIRRASECTYRVCREAEAEQSDLLSVAGQASVQIVHIVKVGVAVAAAEEEQGVRGGG